jgi:hypothetical protein
MPYRKAGVSGGFYSAAPGAFVMFSCPTARTGVGGSNLAFILSTSSGFHALSQGQALVDLEVVRKCGELVVLMPYRKDERWWRCSSTRIL